MTAHRREDLIQTPIFSTGVFTYSGAKFPRRRLRNPLNASGLLFQHFVNVEQGAPIKLIASLRSYAGAAAGYLYGSVHMARLFVGAMSTPKPCGRER